MKQIKGCGSLTNLVTVLITIVIIVSITSFCTYIFLPLEVQVHWSEWCFCASPEDSIVVPSSQPLLARTSTDMKM